MKEILITKERNNEKFQEFRKMILENLAIVLKIICGDKFLIHKFDTKDYMDYEPKFVTKEEYAMNMVERDLHEVYNIMTQGYTEVCNGGSIEKRYLTDKYNVSTLVSTETKTKNNTQEIKMKDGKEKMVRNVRVLEESVEKGLLQGYALESAKQTLEKIDHRTTGVDTWVLENNEGTYGTEIVITKDGHIDLYLCIMEKYASRVSYIRVGNFQPEYELGDVWLPNGKVKEYQKLGTIINALNKEYEKYGFYFTADTKNNRRILADARKSYELFKVEEKERKRKENLVKDLVSLSGSTLCGLLRELGHEGRVFYEDTEELERELVKFFEESDKKYDCWQDVFADYKENYLEVERLKKNLVKKEQELLSKEVTFDIDGEGKVEEIKDASYADANENYKRRRYQAPEKGNGYNKTYVTMKLDGKKFHDMVICLHGETEHHNLKDAILAQLKVLRKTWVEGDGVPYFKPEKNKEIIEKKYGSKEKLAIALDAKEMVVRNLGIESEIVIETHIEKMEEKQMNTINKNALTNRMAKLGEFLKENRDKDAVENKVLELFPKAMEVEVFEGDNVVHFLVGQEYVGKAPTKKEMKELDYLFDETIKVYGLSVHISVDKYNIKIDASVGVDYRDIYGHYHYTDCTVKEIEMKLELTMENAQDAKWREPEKKPVPQDEDFVELRPVKLNDNTYKYDILYAGMLINGTKVTGTDEDGDEIKRIEGIDADGNIFIDCEFEYLRPVIEKKYTELETTDELEKQIKDHINAILDLSSQENHGVGYMYKKTIAVKKETGYEFTSMFEDIWTGMNVYIGDSGNMIMIPNSSKSFLTDIVEDFLCSNIGINETVEKIKEKIKRKFEYTYSKSVTVKEEEQIYALVHNDNIELFWKYSDAYNKMIEDAKRTAEEWAIGHGLIIDDYSAKVETFKWDIVGKIIK